jgi:hypothetical protein
VFRVAVSMVHIGLLICGWTMSGALVTRRPFYNAHMLGLGPTVVMRRRRPQEWCVTTNQLTSIHLSQVS